jgi:F-type H+-transporting ATPase subunit b
VSAILEQLELNQTFFIQLAIFAVLFFVLKRAFFKPFLDLLEMRHKKTVEDREAAERLMSQAENKLEDYKNRLAAERAVARKNIDEMLMAARKEEAALLAEAREEARKITQEAADSAAAQGQNLSKQLELEVESMARAVSEKLLSRKV